MGKNKLTLVIELKDKLFNSKLAKAQKKLRKTTDKMKGNVSRLKTDFLSNFKQMRSEVPLLGRAFDLLGNPYVQITAGIVAVTGLLSSATNYAKRFEHEFLNIRNLNLDKTQTSLTDYKKEIMDTAFVTGQNLEKATTAYYDLQSATGLYGKQATEVFKKVAKYSTATGADLNDSINATTKAMKAFNLSNKDIDKYLESNAKTVQTGIVTFKELARVQTEYAGAAAGAGQSVDTANKLFAVFTSITKDARIGATMTKTAFLGLTQESTIKGLKSIGVKIYDANGKMKDLGGILTDVKDKFKNMSSEQIDAIINKIGGPEGLRNMFIKLKTNANDFEKTMATFDSSKFTLGKAFKNATNDATVLGDRIRNRFGVIMARLGDKILPAVNWILNKIDKTLQWLYNHFDDIVDVISSVATAAGIMATYFGVSAIASVGLSGALGLVTAGLTAIRVAIFNIPLVGWILLAISAIVLLIKKTDGWKEQWINLKNYISDIFDTIVIAIKFKIQKIIDNFQSKLDFIKKIYYKTKNALGIGDKAENNKAIAAINEAAAMRKSEMAITEAKLKAQLNNNREFQWKLHWKKKNKQEQGQDNAKTEDLLSGNNDPLKTNDNTTNNNTDTGNQINSVTGKASAPRSITINIDSLIKGGVNVNKEEINNMTPQELEEMLTEMMMRVVRGTELMGG